MNLYFFRCSICAGEVNVLHVETEGPLEERVPVTSTAEFYRTSLEVVLGRNTRGVSFTDGMSSLFGVVGRNTEIVSKFSILLWV